MGEKDDTVGQVGEVDCTQYLGLYLVPRQSRHLDLTVIKFVKLNRCGKVSFGIFLFYFYFLLF